MDLKYKVALITGAAKRIGKALALALAEQGCHIIVHYNQSAETAQETVAEIEKLGVKAWPIQADLSKQTASKRLIPFAIKQAGRLDILINNASLFPPEDLLTTTLASWEQVMTVNLQTPFLLSQAFARSLPNERQGKIINLLDTIAIRPQNHHFSYTISKVGLQGLTQATAHALAARNIQVNGLALGAILPNINEPNRFEKLVKRIPARRTGSVEDVSEALLYLLQADYVTGEIIRIDGGRHLV